MRFGARDYDPVVGRWVRKDPKKFTGGVNFYVYASNDPVNRVDLTGGKDRPWPFNGQITNHSADTVWGYNWDLDEFVPVPPRSESSNDMDLDFVEVNGDWYKIGPWDFDVDERGNPDDGFDAASPDEERWIRDWYKRHPHQDWRGPVCTPTYSSLRCRGSPRRANTLHRTASSVVIVLWLQLAWALLRRGGTTGFDRRRSIVVVCVAGVSVSFLIFAQFGYIYDLMGSVLYRPC